MIRLQPRLFMQFLRSIVLTIALVMVTNIPGFAQAPTRSILRVGSQGTDVTELQSTLKLLGYYAGAVNGVFEESTAQAVTRFQSAAGITADGIVGSETWNRLFPTSEPVAVNPPQRPQTPVESRRPEPAPSGEFPILRRGARGEAVRGLQNRLSAIGVYQGEIDGIFGPGTEEAVKAAQNKFGLEADGIVGGATWAAILR
ncbi:peptidoglycan-binding domain-containing protein [Leptolyngbya sp. AN03gr2]|uniref:peptidoglycan-binding domain-containing protein n=1 Tax=unclassified Leptolyngbya TaxID=2650499 RepID=UPI003D3137B1